MRTLPVTVALALLIASPARALTLGPPQPFAGRVTALRVGSDGTARAALLAADGSASLLAAAPSAPFGPLPTAPLAGVSEPSLGLAEDGSGVALLDGPALDATLIAQPFAADGTLLPAEPLATGAEPDTVLLDVGPDGTAVASWFAQGRLHAAFRAPGAGAFGTPITLVGRYEDAIDVAGTAGRSALLLLGRGAPAIVAVRAGVPGRPRPLPGLRTMAFALGSDGSGLLVAERAGPHAPTVRPAAATLAPGASRFGPLRTLPGPATRAADAPVPAAAVAPDGQRFAALPSTAGVALLAGPGLRQRSTLALPRADDAVVVLTAGSGGALGLARSSRQGRRLDVAVRPSGGRFAVAATTAIPASSSRPTGVELAALTPQGGLIVALYGDQPEHSAIVRASP